MKQITVYIDEKSLEYIDKLVELQIYPSRNEAMRTSFRDFISKESDRLSKINADMMKLNDIHRKMIEFENSLKRRFSRDIND